MRADGAAVEATGCVAELFDEVLDLCVDVTCMYVFQVGMGFWLVCCDWCCRVGCAAHDVVDATCEGFDWACW